MLYPFDLHDLAETLFYDVGRVLGDVLPKGSELVFFAEFNELFFRDNDDFGWLTGALDACGIAWHLFMIKHLQEVLDSLTAIRISKLTLQHDVFESHNNPILDHIQEKILMLLPAVFHIQWVIVPLCIAWVFKHFHLIRLKKRRTLHIVP